MSMKRLNLNDLALILDETIAKGGEIEEQDLKKSLLKRIDIRKALSHDPFTPVNMGHDSEYYNPYKYSYEDGAYMPHTPEYWYEQGKDPQVDEYHTVQRFYGRKVDMSATMSRFSDLRRSLDSTDLVKAGAVPVGTIHTYKDGMKYKKIAEGKWSPVAGNEYGGGHDQEKMHHRLMSPDARERQHGSKALDYHAEQKSKIQEAINQKQKQAEDEHGAKTAALDHVKAATEFIHGKNVPTHIKHKMNEFEAKTAEEHPHKQALTKLNQDLNLKPHKVKVDMTINGKKMSHEFNNVHGNSMDDVREKVAQQLQKILPNARVDKLHIEKQSQITPELQEKIKKLGKGQGRQVDLGASEVKALLESGKYALISAGINPNHEEDKKLTPKQVDERYDSLRKDLREGGYAYSKVTGHYGGKEDSYLVMVHDHDNDHIKELGKKYNQDSVITSNEGKHEMHYTVGDKAGKHNKGEGLDPNAKEAKDFYSEITTDAGKKIKFALNFDFDTVHGDDGEAPAKKPHAISEENLHLSLNDYDLAKGGLAIGTVHTYTDGIKYRKEAEGKWVPVSEGKGKGKKEVAPDKKMSEGKASDKISMIEDLIAQKLGEQGIDSEGKGQQKDGDGKEKKPEDPKGKTGFSTKEVFGDGKKPQKEKEFVGTKADHGKPDNGMGPPPSKNKAFVKRGEELEIDEVDSFIEEFKPDYVEMQGLGADLKANGAKQFGNRLKDKLSLYNKMKGRLKERSLNTATDVIGARALSGSIEDQGKVLDYIKSNFDVVEAEDSSAKSRPDGYRAIHVLFKTKTGKISELQIKTHRQQIYSGFTHDTIYKPSPELADEFGKGPDGRPKNKEVADYLNAVSDYLYRLDKGDKDDKKKRPEEPALLKENGMLFPWKEVEKLEKGDLSSFEGEEKQSKKTYKEFEKQNKGKVKHFVVVRSPKKENLEIQEFDDFDKANAYVKKNQKSHKGEMPMGYSDSKEEFLKVFSEYRPQGWE